MDEVEKLKRLLYYWLEHNNEHAQLYRDWSEEASYIGNEELSKILGRLYYKTKRLNGLFEEAIKRLV